MWNNNVTLTLDHTYGLDLLVTKVRFKDFMASDWGDFRCRHAIDSSSLYLDV